MSPVAVTLPDPMEADVPMRQAVRAEGKEEESSEDDEEDEESSDEEEEGDREWTSSQKNTAKKRGRTRQYALTEAQISDELARQLQDLESYMTQPIHFQRQDAFVEQTTWKTTARGVKQFLGYCLREQHVRDSDFFCFLNLAYYEAYLSWLQNTRGLQPQTIMNHLGTAINVLKFLSRNQAFPNRNYDDIEIIAVLRQVRLQRASARCF